ncbi:3-oxoacyl-ACP reductase FabG [Salinadaptatus halalkaliphilus]|uniref:3-oxoacyl-ACP reductase FabG n=1 Tax=Salinadaptatus halalkaliphilus TaxID=2419781 RepID=A0A4V3VLK2_9EURY|nr:3-oxoacyl-ACP reductase family protein [Salinadaptatus halalkaliphilus]THE65977.1 3-oxoacyl-ACP reductase FabG [Salinadaptatus halalkaliphilus]
MDFSNQTALVTGASRNIGEAIAVSIAEAGGDVGVTSKSDERACRATADRIEAAGGDATVVCGDLGEPDDIERIVRTVREELGSIDILVNNATVRPRKPFLEVDEDDLDTVLETNVKGTFLTTQHVVPEMIAAGGGSIVNLIGAMVYLGRTGKSHSYASKLGIEGQVRQLASELGPEGIRVNAVSPGLIDTDRDEPIDGKDDLLESIPLQRAGDPAEVADACCFLASDQASFITGQVLHVNGGIYPTPNVISPE